MAGGISKMRVDEFKGIAVERLAHAAGLSSERVEGLLEAPQDSSFGDWALPCFKLAKELRKSPNIIAEEIAQKVDTSPPFEKVEPVGGYVNITFSPRDVLESILGEMDEGDLVFGHNRDHAGRTAVVDYSSPNIAKPLAFHHIRSTMIGNALVKILAANGYKVVGINHLGDWGTSFGYLIDRLESLTDEELSRISLEGFMEQYVQARSAEAQDPSITERARLAFRRLEESEESALRVWRRVRDASLSRFQEVYRILGVRFDEIKGEAEFHLEAGRVIEELKEKGLARESNGAVVVDLSEHGIETPCLLRKSDGATLYSTRDLAAAKYRAKKYGFDLMLYVTDQGQSLHFKQVFKVLELMGYPWAENLRHVDFGPVLMWSEEDEAWVKGQTRSGRTILLEEVFDEVVKRVMGIIDERDPGFEDKEEVARAIGVGAVVFNDLRPRRHKEARFKLEDAVSLEGETGPYVQNARVRVLGIFRKAKRHRPKRADLGLLNHPREHAIIRTMARFPDTVRQACRELEPSLVADYLIQLSRAFHAFHHDCRVLDPENPGLTEARLLLTWAVGEVLRAGMELLGMVPIKRM